jgi:hypothetical protein
LSYQTHITNIVSNARHRSSTLLRGFVSRRLDIMRKAFITYIRPILEYNCLVWNPCQIHFIDSLENVQRNFSKRIPSLSHLTYFERLALLNLEPLELRRLRFDLTYYYKTLHNLTPFNPDKVFRIYTPLEASRSNSPCKSLATLTQHFYHPSSTAAVTHGTICLLTCVMTRLRQFLKKQLNVSICPVFSKVLPSDSNIVYTSLSSYTF